jgi:hypothetical protein
VIALENGVARHLQEVDDGEVESTETGEMTLVIVTDVDEMNLLTPKEGHDGTVVKDLPSPMMLVILTFCQDRR